MISPAHAQTMARYNHWQNQSLYRSADRLPDSERKRARGAFFESIHGTLSHIYFGDQIWMHRFTGTTPLPIAKSIEQSATAMPDWYELKSSRFAFDDTIIAWSDALQQSDLDGELTWTSMAAGTQFSRPRWLLITHFFNHQTHHRGQVHCLLTQNGLKMEDTDLPFMP